MLCKPHNKYSVNTPIKYHENMIQRDHSNLAPVSQNSNLTILEATKVLKVAGFDNISRRFPIHGAKLLPKYYYNVLYHLLITLKLFSDSCKVAKLKSLYKKD